MTQVKIKLNEGDLPNTKRSPRFSRHPDRIVQPSPNDTVIVPYHYKFASPVDERWQVHDEIPNQWSDLVKRLLLSAGPAAFGGSQPNKWFIHYKEGPKEDVKATYVWLGYLEKGYAIRKNGPARSPEK